MSGQFPKMTMNMIPIHGKTVLLRVDYNVPLTHDNKVVDDYRIRMSIPTVRALLKDSCKVVIVSHLGRPSGKVVPRLSLEPVARRLAELLHEPVRFVDDCVGQKVYMAVKRAPKRSVTVLENLRFYPGEEADSIAFARQLAKQSRADYFIQDGFGVVHRRHASTDAITQFLPGVAGPLLKKEYITMTRAMEHPKRPLVAVLGGAKVSDKIGVIGALIDVADTILIGGAMANTILAHRGYAMAESKVEPGQQAIVDALYEKAAEKVGAKNVDTFMVLPVDVGVGHSISMTATRQDVPIAAIPAGSKALDIGPKTRKRFASILQNAKTVIWNGPLGMTDVPAFSVGTTAIATELMKNKANVTSIIGGGDTADYAMRIDPMHGKSYGFVSTGGGATLALIAGEDLPGITSLLDAH